MSALIAALLALAAALLLGAASAADQLSTKRVKTRQALSPAIVFDLARQPLWLAAIGSNIAGFALQVTALAFGSIALVQPILVSDLIFAVLIVRYLRRRMNLAVPESKRSVFVLYAGLAATTAGVAGFLVIGRPSAGTTHSTFAMLPPLVIGLVVVVGGCLAVAARCPRARPLALALACGVNYGVAAFSIKLVTSDFGHGAAGLFSNWPIYVLAVTGPVGFVLNQDAFQQGTFLAPVQAIITTADPVISIGLGIVWLDVRLRGGPAAVTGEVLTLLLMTAGIAVTSRHSPQVTDREAAERSRGAPAPAKRAAP